MTAPHDVDAAADRGRWLSASELAAYIGVSESWVHQCAAAAGIRKFRLTGRIVRYDRQQVDALILSGRIKRRS